MVLTYVEVEFRERALCHLLTYRQSPDDCMHSITRPVTGSLLNFKLVSYFDKNTNYINF